MPRDFFTGRHAGLLVPLFSIPSRESWGIGEIPDIVRLGCWMREAGLSFLQMLPLNEMAEGQNSPYSALSAMAVDPLYIAPSLVAGCRRARRRDLLSGEERAALRARTPQAAVIQYPAVRAIKSRGVSRGVRSVPCSDEWNAHSPAPRGWRNTFERERWWLDDYTLFRAIHAREDRRHWREWEHGTARPRAGGARPCPRGALDRANPVLRLSAVAGRASSGPMLASECGTSVCSVIFHSW